ncbi:hypothetical protein AX17_000826 [Amanita inopinata Kibby_2008]|nr:hypothetical protein AX17_000826 [Amanita inopinata Kibby_2008]
MAPSFLSRLVKASSPSPHNRERSDRSLESPRTSTSSTSRQRSPSTPNPTAFAEPPAPPLPARIVTTDTTTGKSINASTATINTTDTDSTRPSVTVVPPSPLSQKVGLSTCSSEQDLRAASDRQHSDMSGATAGNNKSSSTSPRPRTISAPPLKSTSEESLLTPKPDAGKLPSHSRPSSPSGSNFASLKQKLQKSTSNLSLAPAAEMRRKASSKSLKTEKAPAPIVVPFPNGHAATFSGEIPDTSNVPATTLTSMSPIVESPTAMRSIESGMSNAPRLSAQSSRPPETTNGKRLQAPSPRDPDNMSMVSATSHDPTKDKEKKRPWRRGSASVRKPTGLAGAIAASGLAMANPTMSAAHYAQFSPSMIQVAQSNGTNTSFKSSNTFQSPIPRTQTSTSTSHVKSRSVEMSPNSAKSARSPAPSLMSPRRRTTAAPSIQSDNNSEYNLDGVEYYELGDDIGYEDEDGSESDDELMDMGLGEEDIPVTGFAVASNKRNADFHELFPNIPEGDYLIEDYGCALQREILIQGRLYLSENHICFHANIFGWITDLSIPMYDVISLDKRMTAFVIPNAIQVSTRQSKYTFASFLSRDTTFDVIYNIWRHARPDDSISYFSSPRGSFEAPVTGQVVPGGLDDTTPPILPKVTECACGRAGKHLPETAMDVIMPGTPDRIHNLIFASGFMKEFMAMNQKLMDIQISDWTPVEPGSKLLTRNMSYIKPLSGSLGPKQTKCEIRDETIHDDPDDYVTMLTTTRTPEVPSGGVFSVKTRTCIMWASAVSSKIVVTTQVEWTGRSFIKGIIEKSAIDGQKVYHTELESAMKAYVQEHQSEFIPVGIDPAAIALAETAASVTRALDAEKGDVGAEGMGLSEEAEQKKREHERNRRSLQWAWDTCDGAYQVARMSTKGALELVRDAWDQSSTTTILYFVVTILLLSNLWSFFRMGTREQVGRRKEIRRAEERDRWVQGVVTALREELAWKAQQQPPLPSVGLPHIGEGDAPPTVGSASWTNEIMDLRKTLDVVEERVKALRESLDEMVRLNSLD